MNIKRSPAVLLALVSGGIIMGLVGIVAPALFLVGAAGAYFAATASPRRALPEEEAPASVPRPGAARTARKPPANEAGQYFLF